MRTRFVVLFSYLLLTSSLGGCDEPGTDPLDGGGPDAGPTPMCEDVSPFETGDATGHAMPLGAGAGEVRAGRLAASDLPEDPTGLAVWAAGDVVIASDTVALIIEDAGESDLYDQYGGRVVGVARVEGGALTRAADFNEILFGLGGFLVGTEAVTILNDGSDGGAAVVRATGPLATIDFAGDLLSAFVRGDFTGWPAALDYTLAPGSSTVEVVLHVDVRAPTAQRVPFLLSGVFQGYRMPSWTTSGGFDTVSSAVPFLAFDGRTQGTSYAWIAPAEREFTQLLDQAGVQVYGAGGITLPGCTRVEVPLGQIAIGASLSEAQAAARGTAHTTYGGVVVESDGTTPAPDVRVHAVSSDGHLTRVLPDDTGRFSLEVESSETGVELWAYRRGFAPVGPLAAGADVTITMPAYGTVEVAASEGGEAVPARVQLFPSAGAPPSVDASWGERPVTSGRLHVEFATGSPVSMRVPAGTYRVVASRGFEVEPYDSMVTVTAGATSMVDAVMTRAFDTPGVLCADYHIHTTRSPDSEDDARLKLAALVADGLELPVRTDHEFVAAFEPIIAEMGLSRWALGLSGEELTTFAWGHFGVFPLEPDATAPSGGAVRWVGRTPDQVFREARGRTGSPALIINHPRSGGGFGGYFTSVGYDPTTGMVANPELWSDQFDAIEVFNDSSWLENRDGTVRDWLSMVGRGMRVAAIGASDSHHIYNAPIGYPRTCLYLGADDPRAVTPAQVRDATREGRSYISGGLHLEVTGPGGERPGDDVAGAGERATLHVVVRAISLLSATTLEVVVDGATSEMITIRPEDASTVDPTILFERDIEVPVAAGGSSAIIAVSSESELEPINRGRMAFAVSNPIYLAR